MKFSIITPTHNRYLLLKRCINSVLNQTYSNFEMIVIDDSTNNETQKKIKQDFFDGRIIYLKNDKNKGVNFSRNKGLDHISSDSNYVVFLDDDDYFSQTALENAKKIILFHKNYKWFICNKKNITFIKAYNKEYDYFNDYLFGNAIQGDVTHFIAKDLVGSTRFSKYIKQAQEYLFFLEISQKAKIFTYNDDATISEYLEGGLTKQNKRKLLKGKLLGVLELLFIRKIPLDCKFSFLKRVFRKLG